MRKNKKFHIIGADDLWPICSPISAPQACNQEAVHASVPYYENSPAVAPPSPAGNEALNTLFDYDKFIEEEYKDWGWKHHKKH